MKEIQPHEKQMTLEEVALILLPHGPERLGTLTSCHRAMLKDYYMYGNSGTAQCCYSPVKKAKFSG